MNEGQPVKNIHKLSIKLYIGPFFFTFAIVMFVLIMQFLWKYIDDLAGKGLEWYVVAELLFYASANLVPLALPLAVLLSSLMTFGNLAENHELMAAKSAGVSLLNMMKPLFFIMVILSIGAFLFSNYSLPKANLKFGSLLWDVKEKKPALDISPGYFYAGIDNYRIYVGKKDNNSQKVYDVLIYDHTSGPDNNVVIKAVSGQMNVTEDERWLLFKLHDGYRYEEIRNQKDAYKSLPHSRTYFEDYEMRFDLSSFKLVRSDIELFKGNYKMLSMSELVSSHDSIFDEMMKLELSTRDYLLPYLHILRDSIIDKYEPRPLDIDSGILAGLPLDKIESINSRAFNNSKTIHFMLNNPQAQYNYFRSMMAKYKIEWHRKIVIAFIVILLYLVGASLGAIIRKGGLGLPSIVSILVFLLFYVISIIGEKLARKGNIDAFSGMWLPVYVLLPITIFLVHKANTDSVLFRREGYAKIAAYFQRKKEARNNEELENKFYAEGN